MISKTLKIGLFVVAVCSMTFVNAQEHRGKKRGNPEKLFKKLDADANGSLSLEEFKAKRTKEDAKETIIEERFKTLDTDANNALSLEEFTIRKELSKEERIEKRFAEMDTDANGSVDIAEYKAFMEQVKKRKGKRKRRRHKKED